MPSRELAPRMDRATLEPLAQMASGCPDLRIDTWQVTRLSKQGRRSICRFAGTGLDRATVCQWSLILKQIQSPENPDAHDTDVRDWVRELDIAIQAAPALAELPGRFWFGIDDGRGDVSGLGADVGVHLLEDSTALLLAGRDTGVRLETAIAVPTMVTVAKRFARIREKAWRIAEIADSTALLENWAVSAVPGGTWEPVTRAPVGWIQQDDCRVTLGAAVPLGVLSARVAEYLAATGAPLVITPWRSVLVCDLDEGAADVALRVLAPMGASLFSGLGILLTTAPMISSPEAPRPASPAFHTGGV